MLSSPKVGMSSVHSLRDITSVPVCSVKKNRIKIKKLFCSKKHKLYNEAAIDKNECGSNFVNQKKINYCFNTYFCLRNNSKQTFSFIRNDGSLCVLTAKLNRSSNCYQIYSSSNEMSKNNSINEFDSEHIANLLFANDYCDFSLRLVGKKSNSEEMEISSNYNSNSDLSFSSNDDQKPTNLFDENNTTTLNDLAGEEILTLQFRRYKKEPSHPRRLSIFFFNQPNMVPSVLKSADPDLNAMHSWEIDLNSDNALKSIKNCRIEDNMHRVFGFVRKSEKDVLEVEAKDSIDELRLFSIAISSFICKK